MNDTMRMALWPKERLHDASSRRSAALTLIGQLEPFYELKSFGARADSLHRVQSHFAAFDELLRIVAVVLGLLIILIVLEARRIEQTEQILKFVQALVRVVQIDDIVPAVHVGQLVDRRQVVRLDEHRVLRLAERQRLDEHRRRIVHTEARLDGGQLSGKWTGGLEDFSIAVSQIDLLNCIHHRPERIGAYLESVRVA